MDLKKLQKLVVSALEDIKGRDIEVLNTTKLTSCSTASSSPPAIPIRQVKALARNVQEKVSEAGGEVISIEGEENGEWVLVDLGDIVVHVMQPAVRVHYNLEELWAARPASRRKGRGRRRRACVFMKLLIAAVGHKMPDWVAAGCNEYIKRMPRELPMSVVEIKPEPRGSKTREQLTAAEKARIAPAIAGCGRIVALDERGKDLTTQQLAQRLEAWMQEGGDTAFLIGGADGLDPELKQGADEMIRLSSLTLPHAMARLVLCEQQLYRAVSVVRNHPYHREG